MKKTVKLLLIPFLIVLMTTAVFAETNVSFTVTQVLLEQTGQTGRVNWDQGPQGTVEAIGIGLPPANVQNMAQARALSRRAAIVDAYRNLGETIQGVQVNSETTMQQLAISSDVVNTRMSAVIRGARILRELPQPDGSYQIVMAVSLYGPGSVAEIALDATRPAQVQNFPPVRSSEPSSPAASVYTGVIIDARGLELVPTFSPRIYDETGRIVYGNMYIDQTRAISEGMVEYSLDNKMFEEAVQGGSRAGARPMVIKAVAVKEHGCNVVISNSDADGLLKANEGAGFLRKLAIVFAK